MRAFTWATLAAAAVVIVPPWSPPAWLTVTVAVMLFIVAVNALADRA